MSISDERLAELMELASRSGPRAIADLSDMEAALRELQQLRKAVRAHNAFYSWYQIECPPAS